MTPLLLLPPSEGKADGGDGAPWRDTATGREPLAAARAELVETLGVALRDPAQDAEAVLRYGSEDVLARAVALDLEVDTAPTVPAIERYTGVVLDAVGRPELTRQARARLDETVWFVSGMWGLVAATDPIPDYRLKIGAKVPGLGVLGTWWRSKVTPVVEELAESRLVWDLLTTEHRRVWRPAGAARAVASVDFRTAERGRRGVSNYHGKHLKGRFVRHLVTVGADLDAATSFTHEGWTFDRAASDLDGAAPQLVFTAPGP